MTTLLIISIVINVIVVTMCYFIHKEVCWLRNKTLDLNARILGQTRATLNRESDCLDTIQELVDKIKKYIGL